MKYALALLCLVSTNVYAWGRRGHQIVGETAAQIAGESGVKAHSFDVGFYANVPDIIWKRPATFDTERKQHFMDMEKFKAAFKARPEVATPFRLSRADFDRTFPELKTDAGRAYWRIREMFARLTKIGERLKAKELTRAERHELQLDWLVSGGVMGHYIGDLGQPLHVSENYDGELTNQRGIHSFFEDVCVDELYPEIAAKVMAKVRAAWPAYSKANAETDVLALTEKLAEDSNRAIPGLLEIDRRQGRENRARACAKFEPLLVARMSASSLLLAELFRRTLGWPFDNVRFFSYAGEPTYIQPGEAAP